jgi:regulator of sirC expression with transglutaminase-like and TPR domain
MSVPAPKFYDYSRNFWILQYISQRSGFPDTLAGLRLAADPVTRSAGFDLKPVAF